MARTRPARVGADLERRRRSALRAVQREQILEGFAAALAAKGYRATTIADIAAAARVSKTTFNEHFTHKEAVFLALHATVARATVDAIDRRRRETGDEPDWRVRVRQMAAGYLDAMAANPAFLLQVMTEAALTSPATRAARADALDRFAERMTTMARDLAATAPEIPHLPHDLAVAALAGVLELVGRAAPRGPAAVRALANDVGELLVRVIAPPRATDRGRTTPRGSARSARSRRARAR